ncbi:MAG TPA: hypothetical protein VMU96_08680 [Casimicrobiaceae bacterium]|nr:hypothetical protein [Casimicrobiaceae bacterium]
MLDAQPLALEDRLRELRDGLDVGLGCAFLGLLGSQVLRGRFDRVTETLMVKLRSG